MIKYFKKGKVLTVAAIAAAGIIGAACTSAQDQANNNDVKNSAQALVQLQQNQPTPLYNWSQLRETLIQIENTQAHSVQTTSFFFNQGVQDPTASCPSIGMPIASTSELTNPLQANGTVAIGQADPTGIYSGNSTGTYVVCVSPDGSNYLNYFEGFVQTVTGPAVWNTTTHQVELTGPSSVTVHTHK